MIGALFRRKSSNTWVQLLRYLFVGGAAFIVDFGLLYALTEWGNIHYTYSAGLSFTAGLIVNYAISVRWVFDSRRLKSRWGEFTVYAIIGIVGLGLNVSIIWTFTDFLHFHYLVSKIVAAVLVLLWNFIMRKFILFDTKK